MKNGTYIIIARKAKVALSVVRQLSQRLVAIHAPVVRPATKKDLLCRREGQKRILCDLLRLMEDPAIHWICTLETPKFP
ncbi:MULTISPECIES: hypothetical protein [unclassified Serratia (in: enterobacteria)]|uniref:hypothetical protein n=1 Tax=unclassified Serratia (in: enterobacteria) TaxID=2647522 RepID=UPI00307661A6